MLGLAAVGVAAGGCTSVRTLQIPSPRPVADATTTTTVGPLSTVTVAESPVAGAAPSTSVAVGPGAARINGTVLGPAGPVEGATVEVQRFVGDSAGTIEATTAADGSFDLPGLRGGRYLVRAWQAPSLAETAPQLFFLDANGTQTLNLRLTSYTGLAVATDLNPTSPFTGAPVNLAVEVTQPTVESNGEVIQVPQVSVTVRLESTNFIAIGGGPAMATTGLNGIAIIGIACTQNGPAPITLLVGGSTSVTMDTPTCLSPESTSIPTTTVGPASPSPSQSFTTTQPAGTTTTTTPPSTPSLPTTATPTTGPGPITVQTPSTTAPGPPSTGRPTTTEVPGSTP